MAASYIVSKYIHCKYKIKYCYASRLIANTANVVDIADIILTITVPFI